MTALLLILVKISVAILIVAIGMGAALSDIAYLWRRPALLVRSLLAMYVLVPLAAYVMIVVLPLAPAVEAALLVLAVSAGAPLLPRKLQGFGDKAYGFSLVVSSSLIAIVVTPLWIAALARYFDVSVDLSMGKVASAIGMAFLLPLAVGMTLNRLLPAFSQRWSTRLAGVGGIAMTLASLALLATHWDILLDIQFAGMAALLALMAIAIAIGHALGGPSEGDRTTLAIACATRHIGIAVVVATAFPGPRTIVILAAYVIASALVSIPYLRWRRHLAIQAEQRASAGTPARADGVQ